MYLLSQQFISNADFQLIRKENPNCAANKWNRKSRSASLCAREAFSAWLEDTKTQENVFHSFQMLSMFSSAWRESPAPFLVNKQAKKPLLSPQSKLHQDCAAAVSHREAQELHHEAITSPESAPNFLSNL